VILRFLVRWERSYRRWLSYPFGPGSYPEADWDIDGLLFVISDIYRWCWRLASIRGTTIVIHRKNNPRVKPRWYQVVEGHALSSAGPGGSPPARLPTQQS
jgi:hypothetical protein